MINLGLIKNCPSVKVPIRVSGKFTFCTDTRKYHHPSAFVALPGSKVNPLDIIAPLLEKECPLIFFQENPDNSKKVKDLSLTYPKTEFVPVSDSIIFLQEISHQHIKEWKKKESRNTVFAISGSNGKTTHKEMLAFILKQVLPGKIVATEKNNNNHLGVPVTLLDVTDSTEFVVLELGSNHPGEIKTLCDISCPSAGITTNIGATHLEFFGNIKNVFEEEAYLHTAVKENTNGSGFFLINNDDEFLRSLKATPGSITYGEGHDVSARVSFLEDGARIIFNENLLEAHNPHLTGKHNKLNLITCLFIASHFYPQQTSDFTEACKHFRPTKNRSEWLIIEGKSVFLDAYNANPSSMRVALEGFKEQVLEQNISLSDACIVLGDMNELGDSTPQYHEEMGRFVEELGFENVYFVGRFSKYYLQGNSRGKAWPSTNDFKREYQASCLKKFSIHFIKGSRSLQLESLFDIT